MRTIRLLAFAATAVLLPLAVADAQPQQWELLQNEPNPFCGATAIGFAAPEIAEVDLRIWNPEGTEVIRILFEGLVNVGFYQIIWDQADENGVAVGDEHYPYQLIAVDPDTGALLFDASLIATVECDPTPADIETWGRIRGRYARRR